MLNLMTIGAVQEPTEKAKKYYLPNLEFFGLKSKFFEAMEKLVDDGTPLEGLKKAAQSWIDKNLPDDKIYTSLEEMRLEFANLTAILDAIKNADPEKIQSELESLAKSKTKPGDQHIKAVFNTMFAYMILNKKGDIVEYCRDIVLALALLVHFQDGKASDFKAAKPSKSPEPEDIAQFIRDFLRKAQPRIDIRLPALADSTMGLPAIEDNEATPGNPKTVEHTKKNLDDIKAALAEIEIAEIKISNAKQNDIASKEAFIKQRSGPAETLPLKKAVFGDQFGNSAGKPHFFNQKSEVGEHDTSTPTTEELEKAHQEYVNSIRSDWVCKGELERMSARTRELVKESVEVGEGFRVSHAKKALQSRIRRELQSVEMPKATGRAILYGGHLVEINDSVFEEIICGDVPKQCHCELLQELDEKHGSTPQIFILGTGDSYRVDTKFDEYLRGELVHTETVLRGSTKTSNFRKLDRVDEFEETFSSKEEEQSNEVSSDDRFKLESEIESQNKSENEQNFGATLTASYGTASVSANYGMSSSTASADKARKAREISQRKMNRAVSSIKSKTETLRSVRKITETERTSGFEVTNPDPSFTAYYHAIDKVYSNQLMCLGKRLMIRVCMQESMAFLLRCMASGDHEGATLEKPVSPDEAYNPLLGKKLSSPADITPADYEAWVAFFGLSGATPPPGNTTASAMSKGNRASDDDWPVEGGSITIPDGYEARSAIINVMMSGGSGRYIAATVGTSDMTVFNASGKVTRTLPGIQGTTHFAQRGKSGQSWAVTYTLDCFPTSEKMDEWRLSVYDAIWLDYERKKSDYENMIQSMKHEAGIQIQGRNPKANANLIREELYKIVLGATFPQFFYRGFNAMKFGYKCVDGVAGGIPIPEPDFEDAKIEGEWVTFMSQLYEFENMTFKFEPYFFGNRRKWCNLRKLTDVDPLFEQAISSGYVSIDIPIAEDMEPAFFHYLQTGEIFSGNGMPVMGDPLYQAIALELKDAQTSNGVECEAPWKLVLPTSLALIDEAVPSSL